MTTHPSKTENNSQAEKVKRLEYKIAVIALITALIGVIAAIINYLGPKDTKNPTPIPSPTRISTCFSAEDISVRSHILNDQMEIAILAPEESVHLEPGKTFYLQAEIKSVSDKTLPDFICAWTNAHTFSTQGTLLQKSSCKVDYRSGNPDVTDTLSLQLIQQDCTALAPYVFFILP